MKIKLLSEQEFYANRNICAPPLELPLPSINALPLESWSRPTQAAGIYFLADERGIVIYIGQTTSVMQRFGNHLHTKNFHAAWFVPLAVNRETLKGIESCAIVHFRPILNYGGVRSRNGVCKRILYAGGASKRAQRLWQKLMLGELF